MGFKKWINEIEYKGDVESDRSISALKQVLQEYYVGGSVDKEVYAKAYDSRMDYLKDLMREDPTIEIPMIVDEIKYRKTMFSVFRDYIEYKEFASEFEKITDEEILSNKTARTIKLEYFKYKVVREKTNEGSLVKETLSKKYPAGSKLTRVMNFVADIIMENDELKNRVVGNFVSQDFHKKGNELILSAHPLSLVYAGITGNSCISPEGENATGAVATMGYKNMLIAHLPDWTWRAYVSIDPDRKGFEIYNGYPRENELAQVVLHDYLEKRGYKSFRTSGFSFPYYFDNSRRGVYTEDLLERERNYSFNREFFVDYPRTINGLERVSDGIVNVYFCNSCGNGFFDEYELENGYCENCDSALKVCGLCDCEEHYDNMYWSERYNQYVCDTCATLTEPERKEVQEKFEAQFLIELENFLIENGINEKEKINGKEYTMFEIFKGRNGDDFKFSKTIYLMFVIGTIHFDIGWYFRYLLKSENIEKIARFTYKFMEEKMYDFLDDTYI